MDRNKIILGDSLEYLKTMSDKCIDLTLTDIPYGGVNRKSNGLRNLDKGEADVVTFNMYELCEQLIRVTKGSIYMFCGANQVSDIFNIFTKNRLSTRLCVWKKTNPSPMNGEHIWLSGIECCVFGKHAGGTFNQHCKNVVWEFATERGTIHPTQKPIKLFQYLIESSSNEGDLVFDPFSGSGTTAVASKRLRRNYLGVEKNPEWYQASGDRLANEELKMELEFNG